jgi:hypothetical protein
LKQGLDSRRKDELLTKRGCHKEVAPCPRRPHAVKRRLRNCYKEVAGSREQSATLRRKRKI